MNVVVTNIEQSIDINENNVNVSIIEEPQNITAMNVIVREVISNNDVLTDIMFKSIYDANNDGQIDKIDGGIFHL